MDLNAQIENMLNEIIDYGGNFGDPIATEFDFDPLVVLQESESNSFLAFGAAIALLVNFAVYIDNSDYLSAVQSKVAKDIQNCIRSNKISEYSYIVSALNSASENEASFNKALAVVYKNYVANWQKKMPNKCYQSDLDRR
ncbi:hypothetical protein [Gynuella sp.]|uniref:hypothetical protein n=1 Tax=Gynuella sp. TaxID=2969146 RepID=UPI003D0BF31F